LPEVMKAAKQKYTVLMYIDMSLA